MSIFKSRNTSLITRGDLIDIYRLLRLHGLKFFFEHLHLFSNNRAKGKWTRIDCSVSDFWIIPQVQSRWNKIISGDENLIYEDYVVQKYLQGKQNLSLLSVGCGNSSHEQNFSRHHCFSFVEGIDFSEKQVQKAKQYALEDNCKNLHYRVLDFEKEVITNTKYDVVLFHSSLHHFKDISSILKNKVLPIMKANAILILWEYTGPNRLQWTNEQLNKINQLLHQMPSKFRKWQNSEGLKKSVYRPGTLRMRLSDPTEAIASENILSSIHEHFNCLEEKQLGTNLIHPMLKGIAQNFLEHNSETQAMLNWLFVEEANFVINSGKSDFTFGVYAPK